MIICEGRVAAGWPRRVRKLSARFTELPSLVGLRGGEDSEFPREAGKTTRSPFCPDKDSRDSGVMVGAFHSLPADQTIDFPSQPVDAQYDHAAAKGAGTDLSTESGC